MIPSFKNVISTLRNAARLSGSWKPILIAVVLITAHSVFNSKKLYQLYQKDNYQKLQQEIYTLENTIRSTTDIQIIYRVSLDTNITEAYQLYDDNFKIAYWTKKSYILLPNIIQESENSLKYIAIENRPFLISSKRIKDKWMVVMMDIEGYFRGHFYSKYSPRFLSKDNPPYIISAYPQKGSVSYTDNEGHYLFSATKSAANDDMKIWINLILILVEFILLVKGLSYFCEQVSLQYSLIGSLIFVGAVYCMRVGFGSYKIPHQFYSLKLFNPALYKSSVNSLGDLLLLIVATQISILFVRRNLKINYLWIRKWKLEFIIHTIVITILLGEAFSMSKIFHGLVVESSIWFNFNYFPRLTIYSFIGLTIMLMSFINYYFLSSFLVSIISRFRMSGHNIFLSLAINILLIILSYLYLDIERREVYLLLIILIVFLSIVYYIHYFKINSRIIDRTLFLVFASIVTTGLLYINNTRKENLILSSIASNISFGKDKSQEKQLLDYLDSSSSDKLDIQDSVWKERVIIRNIDEYTYSKSLLHKADSSLAPLILIHDEKGRFYLYHNAEKSPQSYSAIYPNNYLNRVSLDKKKAISDLIIRDKNISYALYQQDTLLESQGEYRYAKYWSQNNFQKTKSSSTSGEYSLFSFPPNLRVVIHTSEVLTLSLVTQFSYIVCFNIILFIFFEIFSIILNMATSKEFILRSTSLRSKIVITIFLLIFSVFAGISYFSYNNVIDKFNVYNKSQLGERLQNFQIAIQNLLRQGANQDAIAAYIRNIATINDIKISIYETNGSLWATSYRQEDIPETLDPKPFHTVIKSHETLVQDIKGNDGHDILDGYAYIGDKSNQNKLLYISNESNRENRNDATKLIVELLNLYIILFLVAMIIAFWISNLITKPLQLIADKLPSIRLSEKNEYLHYEYNDEIGNLVKKYNSMLDEIERSTRKLVYEEREAAWTSMAKQIAHELKNPLTPMKLKIQFLQKKIKDGNVDIEKLVLTTSETLVEQINNIDTIASSFSNFAKLHQPKIEEIDWMHLIRNVSGVFENNTIHIRFDSDVPKAIIQCDSNQMISVLNNLVKNAIQSYDDTSDVNIDIHLAIVRNQYCLSIRDNGKGIPEDIADKIYTPNFTTKSSGSGLGLPITKKIIKSFGGELSFHSKVGEGTTFYILLPIVYSHLDMSHVYSDIESEWMRKEYRDLSHLDVIIDMPYTGKDNVFHTPLYTNFSHAFGHQILFDKLEIASKELKRQHPNYRLIIWDALRPHHIQKVMWDRYESENKDIYIAPPHKVSMHNYGMAVDIAIVELSQDSPARYALLPFGSDFDEFSDRSHIDYMLLDEKAIDHRLLLKKIMQDAGFHTYQNEWWHFEAGDKGWIRDHLPVID